MEQMRHMAQLHETKFKSQGREVPKELKDQYAQLATLEEEITVTMATKEEELLHLKADRQEFSSELKIVTTWLTQAMEQLQERVIDVPESVYRHEVGLHILVIYCKTTEMPFQLYSPRNVSSFIKTQCFELKTSQSEHVV